MVMIMDILMYMVGYPMLRLSTSVGAPHYWQGSAHTGRQLPPPSTSHLPTPPFNRKHPNGKLLDSTDGLQACQVGFRYVPPPPPPPHMIYSQVLKCNILMSYSEFMRGVSSVDHGLHLASSSAWSLHLMSHD